MAWTDDLTKCKSCKKEYANPAAYYAYPTLNEAAGGGNSPNPWPICEDHWHYALIAGWKPVEIPNTEPLSDVNAGERSE